MTSKTAPITDAPSPYDEISSMMAMISLGFSFLLAAAGTAVGAVVAVACARTCLLQIFRKARMPLIPKAKQAENNVMFCSCIYGKEEREEGR